ncbi:MAG: hypothetical protein ACI9OJ_004182 [Myxococcota bacterium]|jgi:hypothetical protein
MEPGARTAKVRTVDGMPPNLSRYLALITWGLLAGACASDVSETATEACLADLASTDSCSPLYTPTFNNIHQNTMLVSCAVAGGACHSTQGAKGGLDLEDADAAYDLLLGSDGRARVVAGKADCGMLVARLEATDSTVMPVGQPLSDAERCAIRQWIANGAVR